MRLDLVAVLHLLVLLESLALPRIGNWRNDLSPVQRPGGTYSRELADDERAKHGHKRERREEGGRSSLKSKVTDFNRSSTREINEDSSNSTINMWSLEGSEGFPGEWETSDTHTRDLTGSACAVREDGRNGLGWSHLEVTGVLRSYERGFMEDVRQSRWDEDDLDTVGLCSGDDQPPTLWSLHHIASHRVDPRGKRLIVLHLEEVMWEETKLKFKVTTEDGAQLQKELLFSLLVFYPEFKEDILKKQRVKFVVTGEGIQEQVVCLSRETRYLVISTDGIANHSHRRHSFTVSFQIHHHHADKALASAEIQQLLFGRDEKCFRKKMPVLLLFLKGRHQEVGVVLPIPSPQLDEGAESNTILYPHHRLPADSPTQPLRMNSAANESSSETTGEFLESLTRFVSLVLSTCDDKPSNSLPPLDLDSETLEMLPSHLLNISKKRALEWLVESEEHLVLLLPSESKSLLERQFAQQRLKGKLLEKLINKLQALIDELREIPAFQDNTQLLMDLLDFCYGSFKVAFSPSVMRSSLREKSQQERSSGHGKLHTLLLLKALQSVKEQWQEKRKLSRQNRSADSPAHCKLQELTINFTSISLSKNLVVLPTAYTLNNCEGHCRLPQSTRSDSTTHTILLIRMQESGVTLRRHPCCVPIRYSELQMATYTEDGIRIRFYPNMIADECGCR